MRAPDVAWVSHERLTNVSSDDLKKFAHVCPDFVIDLVSESDELRELQDKMSKWLNNGVRLGWLVNPFQQQTTIYRPDQEPEIKPFNKRLSGEDVLSGFELTISELL
ncbi:hypothetical protein GCM10023187_24040 [Nibrella viscosa]|uniref:Putative restriction endonuclease domain-containing protein n=1 Tax=Nibrella viscosa TaxID=1084524 RepID=A0ABP8KFJ0_9BACT